jgi:hypothetical protein
MEQETITQEVVLEKVRQRLGSLYGNAEQAVAEAIAIINEPGQRLSQQTEAPFVSANVSVTQYEAWSPEDRFHYLDNAEKANARWVEQQLQTLNAAWLMVIDGQVIAHGISIQTLPMEQEFDALCEKHEKYPFVFFSPKLFMIEEGTAWHKTKEPGDEYPTVSVKVRGGNSEVQITADFDTGAIEAYFDLNLFLKHGLVKLGARDYERASTHLGKKFHFFTKPLQLYVEDKNSQSMGVKLSAVCIKNWYTSPFVAINPNRTALVGRNLFLMIKPIVHLDFASRQTEIEFHKSIA